MFVGCILYADDIILLSATVDGLQKMLNTCSGTAEKLCLTFNCKKSVCIAIGPRWKHTVYDVSE